jgi:hypothetical protein
MGLLALAAVTMLLVVGWVRFFFPSSRHVERVRDVSWLHQQGR